MLIHTLILILVVLLFSPNSSYADSMESYVASVDSVLVEARDQCGDVKSWEEIQGLKCLQQHDFSIVKKRSAAKIVLILNKIDHSKLTDSEALKLERLLHRTNMFLAEDVEMVEDCPPFEIVLIEFEGVYLVKTKKRG